MAMHRHQLPGVHTLVRALVLTAAAGTALGVTAGGSAFASPGGPGGPPERTDVKTQVDQLYGEAEQASERYNAAQEQQRRLLSETGALQQQMARGQDELNRMRGDLAVLAGAQYRAGGIAPAAQLMLSDDPAGYLSRVSSLDHAAERQNETLHEVAEHQRGLDQRRSETSAKLAELEDSRRVLADNKQQIQERLTRAQRLLDGLGVGGRAGFAAQDAREAERRATRGTDRLDLGTAPPASPRAAAALAAARAKIGSPYVFGATGPGAFDCSGLMYWSWRQAGVTLPRTSQGQAQAGRRVSLADAQPGDLVIFYRDRHHVGMYAGGGVVVHAPYPGARVRYESVGAMPVSEVVRL